MFTYQQDKHKYRSTGIDVNGRSPVALFTYELKLSNKAICLGLITTILEYKFEIDDDVRRIPMTATVIDYIPHTHIAMVGNKEFTVRNLIPVFVDENRRKETRYQIEITLFEIFQKYIS